jgi:hypothetical protein
MNASHFALQSSFIVHFADQQGWEEDLILSLGLGLCLLISKYFWLIQMLMYW